MTVILINAFLTIIAMGRLWAHIFWRNGREGDASEAPNANLRPLNNRDRVWGFWPAMALAAVIVLLGFFPQPLATAGFEAAQTIVDSSSYVAAVAPAGVR
jgi:multicomponent Na+:H+ antiporter subunit D